MKCIAAGIAALLVLAGSASAGNKVTFPDTTGDASTGQLDVTSVAVQADNTGTLFTFTIAIPGLPPLPSDAHVFFVFDTDNNLTDGNKGTGTDVVVEFTASDNHFVYKKWDGTKFVQYTPPSDPAAPTYEPGSVTLAVDLTGVLSSPVLHFVVAAGRGAPGPNLDGYDLVPDSGFDPFWVNPRVLSAAAHFYPARPRAGGSFELADVALQLVSHDDVSAESSSCRATLAGKKLAGKGEGRCTWTIPKRARGKRLVIRVTYHFQGVTGTTASYVFRVG
jgi:hypothetical protein